MPIPAIVKDLNSVPEAHRSLYIAYTHNGESFHRLDVDPAEGFALENVHGLKEALGSERRAREAAEKATKVYTEALGETDPATIAKSLAKLDELQKIDVKSEAGKLAQAQIDAFKEQIVAKHQQELSAKDGEIKTLSGEIRGHLVDTEIAKVLSEDDTKGSFELLAPVMRHQIDVIVDPASQKRVAVVVDDSGNPRVGDSGGGYMPIKALAKELRGSQVYGRAFDGSKASGSGAGDHGTRLPAGRQMQGDASKMSPVSKIAAGLDAQG